MEAAITANKNSRRVVLILSTASILAFFGFWNSRQTLNVNWIDSRIDNKTKYIQVLNKIKNLELGKKDDCDTLRELTNQESFQTSIPICDSFKVFWEEYKASKKDSNAQKTHKYFILNLKDTDENFKDKIKEIFEIQVFPIESGNNISPKSNLDLLLEIEKQDLEFLIRTKRENVTLLRIPFFYTSLDVNDLGLISGVCFAVMFFWLRSSLWVELISIKRVFSRIENSKKEYQNYYEYLSMHQLFVIPPISDENLKIKEFSKIGSKRFNGIMLDFYNFLEKWGYIKNVLRKPWKFVAYFFISLPIVTQLIILRNDIVTFDVGAQNNYYNTLAIVVFEVLILLFNGMISFACIYLVLQIKEEWNEIELKIYYPSFHHADFKNPKQLISRLRAAKENSTERYILEELPTLKQHLEKIKESNLDERTTEKLLPIVIADFNRLLKGKTAIYDEQKFAKVKLTETAKNLLDKNPKGENLALLNRLLLEIVFSAEIAKSKLSTNTILTQEDDGSDDKPSSGKSK